MKKRNNPSLLELQEQVNSLECEAVLLKGSLRRDYFLKGVYVGSALTGMILFSMLIAAKLFHLIPFPFLLQN